MSVDVERLIADDPRSRWHREGDDMHRRNWECIPVTAAVETLAQAEAERERLREALDEDARLLHHSVHPDTDFEACDGARCLRRRELLAEAERVRLVTDGLAALITEVLRKYGGTMKGRGDHELYDALVRYRAELRKATR